MSLVENIKSNIYRFTPNQKTFMVIGLSLLFIGHLFMFIKHLFNQN